MATTSRVEIRFEKTRVFGAALEGTLRKRIRETAFAVEGDAKEACPVDTGNLRNSITTTIRGDGLVAEVGTGVEYAEHVEFGTSRMGAQPYLLPAFEANMRKLLDDLESEVGRLRP